MKTLSCLLFVSLLLVVTASAYQPPSGPMLKKAEKTATFNGATPLEWSVRMADSQMSRLDDRLAWKEGGKARWDYTAGLFTLSLLKLNEVKPDERYVNFVTNAIGSFIDDDGNIHGYKAEEYQLDAINPGKTVIALWVLTGDEKYQKCATLLRKQLDDQPRTPEGGFWHKQRYTNQMWLDGLYMAEPFYAEYTKLLDETPDEYEDIGKIILLGLKQIRQAGY